MAPLVNYLNSELLFAKENLSAKSFESILKLTWLHVVEVSDLEKKGRKRRKEGKKDNPTNQLDPVYLRSFPFKERN